MPDIWDEYVKNKKKKAKAASKLAAFVHSADEKIILEDLLEDDEPANYWLCSWRFRICYRRSRQRYWFSVRCECQCTVASDWGEMIS